MPGADDLIATVEAVHAAGLDAEQWPQALAGVAHLIGGVGTTLEVFERPNLRHREFHFCGLPPIAQLEYMDHFAALNPRVPYVARQKLGELGWDYEILDEDAMDHSPFYMEFLAPMDLRYFVSGIVDASAREFAVLTVQQSAKQGHAGRANMALMQRILPHVRQALDVARRLKGADEPRHSLERTLDWLADGAVLVRGNGNVVYANEAFRAIAQRRDGVAITKGELDFTVGDARARFAAALGAVARLKNGDPRAAGSGDFPLPRLSGAPPYLVSVRPLAKTGRGTSADKQADAVVFVHDPLRRHTAAIHVLREIFGLTDAEAHLAQALLAGAPLADYARKRRVSLNTVYTHLRRIKEKTNCTRMAELIGKLNDLQMQLRTD
ncbi:MAG TPA: helix-turn-helix transcriptional regulator [Pseudolabrys sp.]|jgi:DNA-binding CsgD family transcriptional regulator